MDVDRVRLGRALGYGTRHAAKTFAAVVEAAAAPSPRDMSSAAGASGSPAAAPQRGGSPFAAVPGPKNVAAGARSFKRSFWQPLAAFSGALWLRVTGVFFALLACTMGAGAWRLRHTVHLTGSQRLSHRFWVFAAFALLFGYFTCSSFVRAILVERRAADRRR